MILSDREIKEYIDRKLISIDPLSYNSIESGNYRITLGAKILLPIKGKRVSLENIKDQKLYEEHDLTKENYILKPNEFILAQTKELIGLKNNIAAILDGRSTFARLGITIHQSSQFITPGQDPHIITLEVYNAGPFEIELKYEIEVGKLLFFEFREPNIRGYKDYGVYAGQKETTGAKIE